MNVGEAKHFTALTTTTAPFVLKGGRYAIICDIGDIDTVALQATMDGTNWLAVPSLQVAPVVAGEGGGTLPVSFTDVDGFKTADLPPGQYRLAVSGVDTSPAAVASVVRIQ